MPIKRKDFDLGKFDRFYTVKDHPVAKLLRDNKGLAFKADEIIKKVKMNKQTVRSMLRKLRERNQVIHKQPYFAWKK